MELLPTREEHIQLERYKNDLEISLANLNSSMSEEKVRSAKVNASLKEKDDYINSLINIIETTKIEQYNNESKIKNLSHELQENSLKLNNEERIEFNKLKHENKLIKMNLEKSINLSNEISAKLNQSETEKETQSQDLRVELAKERAVSETLRQAIIDMQIEKEELEKKISSKDEVIIEQGKEITGFQLDLKDMNETYKALHIIKNIENILNTTSYQITTICNVIDRQLLQNSEDIKNNFGF